MIKGASVRLVQKREEEGNIVKNLLQNVKLHTRYLGVECYVQHAVAHFSSSNTRRTAAEVKSNGVLVDTSQREENKHNRFCLTMVAGSGWW